MDTKKENEIVVNEKKPPPSKRSKTAQFFKVALILIIGGLGYGFIEILFRGNTHWSMVLTGGAVFLTFYYLNKQYKNAPILLKALAGALIITLYELVAGLVVNLWFGMNVWDYSHLDGHLWGQICPLFTFLWFLLCLALATFETLFRSGLRLIRKIAA